MFRRIRSVDGVPERVLGRMQRMDQEQLLLAIETSLGRATECFDGLRNSALDLGWLLQELETQTATALAATQALRERGVA